MTAPCELVQIEYQGNGSQVIFPFPFPYEFKTEIKVALWNNSQKKHVDIATNDATYPWEVSDANPTAVTFTSTAPAAPPAAGVNEDPIYNVRIYRTTDLTDIRAVFNQASAIRATDLNRNFDQLRSAIQEGRCQVSDEVYDYLEEYYWNKFDETIYSTANGGTWVSNDTKIASTAATDERIDDKIDTAITNDIGTDGTGITVTDDGDGTITLGLADNTIDFSKIKDVDIITYAEQNAGSPSWDSDSRLATTYAIAKRHDALVQTATPSGTDWQVGKIWLQNDANKTLSVWNGSTWLGIASGGTFTTQPTVIYVDSVNGDDVNDGHRIINPKETIKAAVADANDGDIIIVAPGTYQETLPIDITVNNLSIVGSSQRSCFIIPAVGDEEETMFRCNSGTYIDGFTFTGLKASGTRGNNALDDDPTYGLPENQGWVASFYPGCTILKSPYINNCTSYMDSAVDNANFNPNNPAGTGGDITSAMTGGGILVDGSVPATASPLRSFVVNEFTQVNLDGPGLLVCNNGYAQAVSFFALFCHYHAKALSGGQINMEVGTTDFGRYGLIADGKSGSTIFTATANGSASTGATSFLINAPTASAGWFGTATRPANTMLVQVGGNIYPILSSTASGSGWNVVISNPNPSNRGENLGLVNGHSSGAAVNFYLRSQISAAAHTFEYAGSGVNYTALPQNGGVANESNQVIQTGAAAIAGGQTEGAVFYSSTDENGKFKVGDTFQVDQKTGFVTIDPTSIAINLVSDLSPQLGGNLDVLTRSITTSVTNGDVVITPNGTGNVVLDGLRYPEADGSAGQFIRTDGAGNLTFQSAITEVLEDTTPQLGGNLDLNSHNITGTGNVSITGTVTATSFTGSSSGLTGLFKNVVEDTSPQLGGNLDVNGNNITGTGNVNITGSVTATSFSGSGASITNVLHDLVEDTTPQLGGNLDILTRSINTSTSNGDIDLDANGSGLIKVTEYNLSQVPVVTQHDIGTAANEVPLNGYLGGMAFQDPTSVTVDRLLVSAGFTVATLPTGVVGLVARVTDASAPAVGSTVVGGGAAAALCWYNGSAWKVIGV